MRRLGEIAAGGGQLHPGAKNAPGWGEEILPSLDPRLVMVSGQSGASDPVRAYPDAAGRGGGRPSKLNVPFFPGAYISGAVVGADSSQAAQASSFCEQNKYFPALCSDSYNLWAARRALGQKGHYVCGQPGCVRSSNKGRGQGSSSSNSDICALVDRSSIARIERAPSKSDPADLPSGSLELPLATGPKIELLSRESARKRLEEMVADSKHGRRSPNGHGGNCQADGRSSGSCAKRGQCGARSRSRLFAASRG